MKNTSIMIGICLFLFSVLIGCETIDDVTGTDDESTIYLYNYDEDYAYFIELRLVSDDSLVESCHVDEYGEKYDDDEFEEVDENYYYIAIYQNSGSDETGRSSTFHLTDGEDACFMIEDDGDIKDCD